MFDGIVPKNRKIHLRADSAPINGLSLPKPFCDVHFGYITKDPEKVTCQRCWHTVFAASYNTIRLPNATPPNAPRE